MAQQYYYIAHHGIKGQRWGIRRWRNYDDTLTEAGKKRYGDGGAKMIKKAEKERRRREKILSDPKKLYKHRSEFTANEIQNAMSKMDAEERLRQKAYESKRAEEARKIDMARLKSDWKNQQAKAKTAQAIEDERLRAAKNQEARNAKAAKEKLAADKRKEQREIEKAKADEEKTKWPDRAKKLAGVIGVATSGKKIFDELGITDPDDGKTLFGSLGAALGFGSKKASDVADTADGESKKSKASKKAKGAQTESAEETIASVKEAVSEAMSGAKGVKGKREAPEGQSEKERESLIKKGEKLQKALEKVNERETKEKQREFQKQIDEVEDLFEDVLKDVKKSSGAVSGLGNLLEAEQKLKTIKADEYPSVSSSYVSGLKSSLENYLSKEESKAVSNHMSEVNKTPITDIFNLSSQSFSAPSKVNDAYKKNLAQYESLNRRSPVDEKKRQKRLQKYLGQARYDSVT